MSPTLTWADVAIRLALAFAASFLIGINRGGHGRIAGLRTTILVCLAAAAAMLEAKLLLSTAGRPGNSFVTLDPMRLPLGVLSGMGFIGAGAILHRSGAVIGVTTAATLWVTTMIGICLGSSQIILGLSVAALSLIVLWALAWAEQKMVQDQRATPTVAIAADCVPDADIHSRLRQAGFRIIREMVVYTSDARIREKRYEVTWRARRTAVRPPDVLSDLAHRPGLHTLRWIPDEPS